MPRRDGPTTISNRSAHDLGFDYRPRSGKQMNADVQDRHAAEELRRMVQQNPDYGPRIGRLRKLPAREILRIVRDEEQQN
ncbi:hypothetical protein [Bradyrhizobium erythrophlei]|uniref:Uncharacterized protein n=1 Tax=Bradyrhizobium erythrophlei TaxID=1437360 RepID=A0A1M5R508_9BRAD|nr:hypothetical protein [Bradyrhizobium erythrophlei]SHH21186.1 hypothetical protein SAMN05444169_6338 [Bradyrhizobium erythrophlei]